ncbi:hypothetical protein BST61_g1505 [Cercospora zeina]
MLGHVIHPTGDEDAKLGRHKSHLTAHCLGPESPYIINLSLAQIAKWPTGNYTNPHRRKWMPGYASFLYTLSVLTRALSRISQSRHTDTRSTALLGLDDIILGLGWALLTSFTILNILGSETYMTSRHKIGLYAVFSAGLLVVAAGSVRTYHLYPYNFLHNRTEVGHSSDVSSIVFDVFAWSQAELCMGFMCACAPSLRMFGRQYFRGSYLRLKRHISPLIIRGRRPPRKGERGGSDASGGLELSIRKLDCPYEQVRNDFSHVTKQRKKDLMMESNFTDVTTLVQQEGLDDDDADADDDDEKLGIRKPKRAKLRDERLVLPPPFTTVRTERGVGKRQRQQQKQDRRASLMGHSPHSSGGTDESANSARTSAMDESKEINLQDNIIVDGCNRSWLEEGFEGDGTRMLKSYI